MISELSTRRGGPGRDFAFSGLWVVPGPVARVREVLVDLERYPTWWPEVRAVASLGPDDALVICRSWLPYSLELHLTALRRDPDRLETGIGGDLEGWARWLLDPVADGTRIRFEQICRVTRRHLTFASYLARPLLVANHDRMMESGIRGLVSRLDHG